MGMAIKNVPYMKFCCVSLLLYSLIVIHANGSSIGPQRETSVDLPIINFTCWIQPDNSLFVSLEDLYRRSFKKFGYQFSMSYRPDARSINEVEKNLSDGDCIRTTDYITDNPEVKIIPVEVDVGSTPLAVWTHLSTLKVSSIQDVSSKKIIVGHSLGGRLVEHYFDQHSKAKLQAIPTIESGLKMLRAKRIDAYIGPYSVIVEELKKLGLESDIFHAGDVDQMQGFPYLAPKHKELVEKFEVSLAEEVKLDNQKKIESEREL